ncbi:hypothetical protein E2C01_001155 [Portunus trituberculatus]|uniref:Uncharacterized protein n=1 Tax=Portunus trituberculatus TaxID=210409 RepID=A0A5B7CIN9_PORTR|nr:hypothetical protein [Portunus trituberculatus]
MWFTVRPSGDRQTKHIMTSIYKCHHIPFVLGHPPAQRQHTSPHHEAPVPHTYSSDSSCTSMVRVKWVYELWRLCSCFWKNKNH